MFAQLFSIFIVNLISNFKIVFKGDTHMTFTFRGGGV